ncbi:hypothetical protein sos41_42760 [Alphaproteobacteria bacterium SO-S41]|nr:hypothetical protein sos41_42760 [Alphaproteobacteria bacterium SO-S41]
MPATPNLARVNGVTEDVADDAKSLVGRAADAASDGFDSAADFVTNGVKNLTDGASDVTEWTGDRLSALRDRVQEKPVQTLAIAAGIGALVGYLFLRR